MSNPTYNTVKLDIVVMPITSQLRADPALGEVWVEDWQLAGLLKPSSIKPVFATLEQPLVIRRPGTLSEADQAAVKAAIGEVLG